MHLPVNPVTVRVKGQVFDSNQAPGSVSLLEHHTGPRLRLAVGGLLPMASRTPSPRRNSPPCTRPPRPPARPGGLPSAATPPAASSSGQQVCTQRKPPSPCLPLPSPVFVFLARSALAAVLTAPTASTPAHATAEQPGCSRQNIHTCHPQWRTRKILSGMIAMATRTSFWPLPSTP